MESTEYPRKANAWLTENQITVKPTAELKDLEHIFPVEIKIGSLTFALKPKTSGQLKNQKINSQVFDNLTSAGCKLHEPNSNQKIKSGINEYDDFIIPGTTTLSVNLGNRPESCQIDIGNPFKVNHVSGSQLFLTGYLAAHRSVGTLVVNISHDGITEAVKCDFDESFKGGKTRDKYKYFELPIPTTKTEASISLSIEHDFHKPSISSAATNSFYFISDLAIRNKESLQSLDSCTIKCRANSKQPIPQNLEGCFDAFIPTSNSSREGPVELLWSDGGQTILFQPLRENCIFKELGTTAVIARTTSPNYYNLYINGELCLTQWLDNNEAIINIPTQYLNGEPALVELRDHSGSHSFQKIVMQLPRSMTPEEILVKESKPFYPTDITLRAAQRFESLRKHVANPQPGTSSTMISQALNTLEKTYETLDLKYIDVPTHDSPEVSIIIPAHNKIEATYYCINSIILAYNKASYEIIVVDDASTDKTSELETLISGIKVIRNPIPLRFIGACNIGVENARGKYVVLLNNDTEVTEGWLDQLIEAFSLFENVGAVGSKLLYPDGKLQDAGGIVWGTGNPWNYGNHQNPWDPRFTYARQVDYLSGAAVMLTKTIWEEVGGLSDYLKPMYFEDTDLSFKVRDKGYKTYFIPSSIVYHYEGLTSGNDTNSGFKRFQEVNRPKFKRMWRDAFSKNSPDGTLPDIEKDRGIIGRVLFIDYATPKQDQDAGSYAAIQEIKLVQSLGYKVTFLPKNIAYLGSYTNYLNSIGVEVITSPFYPDINSFLSQRANEFDCAYITRYYVAKDTIPKLRKYAPKCKIILNNADLHFLRELRAACSSDQNVEDLTKVEETREAELEMMKLSDCVISYNDIEHAVIYSHTNGAVQPLKCPWVAPSPQKQTQFRSTTGIAFLGSFKHPPNYEGVNWFLTNIFPFLDSSLNIDFNIYGSSMSDSLKEEFNQSRTYPIGFVENIEDVYLNNRLFVAPLLSGAGIKGKVLSALAYGIPTILTPVAAEGIGLRDETDCLIADKPEDWIKSINQLYNNKELWAQLSRNSVEFIKKNYSFDVGREQMLKIFEAVDLFKTHSGAIL